MEEEKIMDQSVLAESVADKIPYEFFDKFLVKPLEPIRVKKEVSTPVSEKPAKKDAEGIEAVDYDKVKTEIVEVDSDYRKGVILKLPSSYNEARNPNNVLNVGDIIVFKDRASEFFDLIKDSRLVSFFNIVAVER